MRIVVLLFALSLAVVTLSAQSGIAGEWTIAVNTPGGTREASLTLKVDGETLSGTMASEQGETAFKGTAKDNTFTMSFDVQTPNGTFTINMSGAVDGDDMKGTMDFGMGTGDFTGKRKAAGR